MKKLIMSTLFLTSIFAYGQNPKINETVPLNTLIWHSWSVNNMVFYFRLDANNRYQLWRTDGITQGSVQLTNFSYDAPTNYNSFSASFSYDYAILGNSTFYFLSFAPSGNQLWRSDGSVAGTYQVILPDVNNTTNKLSTQIIATSSHVFYSIYHPNTAVSDLYSVDASGQSTFLRALTTDGGWKDYTSGYACVFRDKLITSGFNEPLASPSSKYILVSDGTPGGTYKLTDGLPVNRFYYKMMTVGNEWVLVTSQIAGADVELLKIPGTVGNGIGSMVQFYNLNTLTPGNMNDYGYFNIGTNGWLPFGNKHYINNTIFIRARKAGEPFGLWKTDGTAPGTTKVIDPTTGDAYSLDLWGGGFAINNKLLFSSGGSGQFYFTDENGITSQAVSILGNGHFEQNAHLAYSSGRAYFDYTRNLAGNPTPVPLWQTDGTTDNTVSVLPENFSQERNSFLFSSIEPDKIIFANRGAGTSWQICSFNTQYRTWYGKANTDWSNALNWEGGSTPVPTDNVLIPDATTNYPVINSNATINSLWLNGYNKTTTNNAQLSLNGDLGISVSNTVNGSGSMIFSGTTNHIFDGTGTLGLPVILAGGDVTITGGNKTIPQLNFQGAARFFLGNYHLNITQSGGVTGYGNDRFIVTDGSGRLILPPIGTSESSTSTIFPIGSSVGSFTPAIVTNNGTSQKFNARVINGLYSLYNTETPNSPAFTNSAVDKTWFINAEGTGSITNASVQLQWNNGDELPGFNRTSINLAHYVNNAWNRGPAGSASGNGPYTFSRTGLTSFSPFGIANTSLVLPLNLISFTVAHHNNVVRLFWQTVFEQNFSHFIIEKSFNAIDFIPIGRKDAAGSGNTSVYYDYTDQALLVTTVFYRLKMIDLDNTYKFSRIVSVKPALQRSVEVYPNPAGNLLQVQISPQWRGVIILQIADINGKILRTQSLQKDQNSIAASMDLAKLASGIYFLTVESADRNREVIKFIKQ